TVLPGRHGGATTPGSGRPDLLRHCKWQKGSNHCATSTNAPVYPGVDVEARIGAGVAQRSSHHTPAGPALTTGVVPMDACCPALAWMCPHTTSSGLVRWMAARTLTLPRLCPRDETSTAPWGGEWLTSTAPGGQPASRPAACSSVRS